jgi:hypothetical protein
MVILFLIYLGMAQAQPPDAYDIYLKGEEGERMISCSDLACANFRENEQRVEFKLKPKALSRARQFAENNRGIKANLIACGKPLAFHLGSRLSGKEALVTLDISKELGPCVRGAARAIPSCGQ